MADPGFVGAPACRPRILAREAGDREAAGSDGGAILLKAAERRVGLTEAMADCLPDEREPGKVRHEMAELVQQRVCALACDYPDGNDAARLKKDPIHKMLVGQDPVEGEDLASQARPAPPSRGPRRPL